MPVVVEVKSKDDYAKWLSEQKQKLAGAAEDPNKVWDLKDLLAHGDTANPIAPNSLEMTNGAPRTRTFNVGANVNGYPHEGANGPSASFRIRVNQAP